MGPKILIFPLPSPSLGPGVAIPERPVPAGQAPEENFQPIKLVVPHLARPVSLLQAWFPLIEGRRAVWPKETYLSP